MGVFHFLKIVQMVPNRAKHHILLNRGCGIFCRSIIGGSLSKKKKRKRKGALSGLRQFLVIEGPLKMMKNAFHFTSKTLFVLKIFKILS